MRQWRSRKMKIILSIALDNKMAKGILNLSPLSFCIYLPYGDICNNFLLDAIAIAYEEVELNAG